MLRSISIPACSNRRRQLTQLAIIGCLFVRMSYPVWMGATPLTPLQNLCIEVEREEEERAPSSVISLLIDSIGK